jgi:hypothetical protein
VVLPERIELVTIVAIRIANHLIRAGAAVAGYADPEVAADFPVKLGSATSV